MSISASEQPLAKVFTADYRFVVPSFQRAYQWRRTQMSQLIDDVIDACSAKLSQYFLGSLILVREDGARYQVIDGQQRLVSLTILFAVLRYLEDDPQLEESLAGLMVETGDKLRGITPEPRVHLRERDEEFFREYVQQGNLEALFDLHDTDCATQAQRNIMDNVRYAYDELAKMSDEERRVVASFLVNNVMLVIVVTDDLSGAYRIFDVMNMRGMPLTASDVFKAKVIAHIPQSIREAYASRWDDIMEPFGDDAARIERFFEDMHLIITHQPMCEQPIADFSDAVLVPCFDHGEAMNFVDATLRPYVAAWEMLEHPTSTVLPTNVQNLLAGLNDYPTQDWRPVAMWALNHTITNLDDPDTQLFADDAKRDRAVPAQLHDMPWLSEVLEALDRVTGIDALNGEATLRRRQRACMVVRDLERHLPVRRIVGFSVSPDEQRSAMMHLRGELTISDDMKRLLLVRANEQLAGHAIDRPRSLNVIRLLPERLGTTSSFSSWTPSQYDYWVDRIGNYVLTQAGERSFTSLNDFGARRDRMVQSVSSRRFPLTEQLTQLVQLTPDALQQRQHETLQLIAQAWNIRYDAPAGTGTNSDDADDAHNAGTHRARPNSKRVTVAQAVRAGLLTVGETLVWDRPRKHEHWEVTVTADGLRLPDGREFSSPTSAAKAVSDGGSAKIDVWKRPATGQSLADIWKTYRRHHA
ncbi:GmrSD restriction endonuclease domain-containing protein [Bifidobacterium gallicum]|uniref:DUF262 domain-containing protein n=1 Tax=Bifidobacterium gallicum DSM 20093 = LMG 11596 TaxID=561180 RepID=D1NT49_9BIFI|nr:DUF262 domain-containing protein [Bifidobacterium gallicum]EFA23851.1 hypothetical protein BIFGAL_02960 [Bifidobacterium gallicum DSM 20093 = LMG 11596]KFI59160.1 hypothetical protein BGLCM_0746 [Bifidobacterium gallicum DSM 20093 = LMG 11596]